jgi:starch-binding outer membrane protein, SusD/RagB family
MKNIAFIYIILFSLLLVSCEDFLEPNPYNGTYDEEYIWNTPSFAEGILMKAFADVHPSSWRVQNNELMSVLTDDAVSSNVSSVMGNFGQGLQSAYYNLAYLSNWDNDYENIFNLNIFLDNLEQVTFDPDSLTNQRFIRKYKGDAFFLRAYYHWSLLKRYGGKVGDEMLGIPVVKKTLTLEESYTLQRKSYSETVRSIVEDCDSALKYVPKEYIGDDLVTGISYYGSPTESIVRSFIGIVYVYAASPAYNLDNDIALWDSAAVRLSQALKLIDGSLNSDALPERNFHNPEDPDVIWRSPYLQSNYSNEINNYPPSLRGEGLTNPSQNLVDAFGDKKGYPLAESTLYDSINPYLNRDARFYNAIIYNGSTFGLESNIIETHSKGDDSRAKNLSNGTRTGYYLRKLLSPNVSLYPVRKGVEPTFYVSISLTDLYLLFAEAMNELAGPLDQRYGLSARNALLKIRHLTSTSLFLRLREKIKCVRLYVTKEELSFALKTKGIGT